ncbi:hypothetical protein, partial [Paenibacillus popilliae]|uniref:hypothetical protein n=1 Tax=Paenibacillus popilliae TaxID=78057 RepID=UPI0011D2B7DC
MNWDVVTSPVSARNRSQSSTYSVKNIYAISKHTQHIDRAWSLLQLINGAEVAKGKFRQSEVLLVRAPYVHEKLSTGRNMAAFYSLTPREYEYSAQMPAQADMTFREKKYEIMNSAIESIFTGEKEIDVALQEASQKLEQVMHD